jgi:hypothetical protein
MITKNWEQKVSLKNNLQMLRFGEMTVFIRLYSTCLAVKYISLEKKGAKYRCVGYHHIFSRYRERVLFLGSQQSFYGLYSVIMRYTNELDSLDM